MTWELITSLLAVLGLLALDQYVICFSSTCSADEYETKNVYKDRAFVFEGRSFATITTANRQECFLKCAMDCRCLSLNVFGNECQLNADTKDIKNDSLKNAPGFTYYEFLQVQTASFPSCCFISNPCLNGGTCSPVSSMKTKRRFSCLCKSGFYGDLCEIEKPSSCADFLAETIKPLSGEYTILDYFGSPYSVYCDFDYELDFAWTLVLSFSRNNALSVQAKGLLGNLPVDENTPNWERYRLSLPRINSIRQNSTHWRATCTFDQYGVYYGEYIRVNLSVVDFSSYYFDGYNGALACQTIEYMDIMGVKCRDCQFALYHTSDHLAELHLQKSRSYSGCSFDLSSEQHRCSDNGADAVLFIVNHDCYDPRSRCQTTGNSTTQNWFGKRGKKAQ